MDGTVDVIVAGAGPAGWAVADQCARHGLRTMLVAPRPTAAWRPTYGLWRDETAALPDGSRYVEQAAVRAIAGTAYPQHQLCRGYAVLDNDSVLAALTNQDVVAVADRVRAVDRDGTVVLGRGDRVPAAVVLDAPGPGGWLTGPPARRPRVEQSAYGLVLPRTAAARLLDGGAVFMDWRTPPGCPPDPPTFLYAVPVPGDRALVEETSLARRPGLGRAELRARLVARLAAHGVTAAGVPERVRFPVDTPPPPRRGGHPLVPFGAAAGLVHPATGYGLADAFRLAPRVAAAIARSLPDGPAAARRAALAELWPARARVVYRLRSAGLATVLSLPPERVPEFFELFFCLPEHRQRAYLSGRADLTGTAATMAAMFAAASAPLRALMIRAGWAACSPAFPGTARHTPDTRAPGR